VLDRMIECANWMLEDGLYSRVRFPPTPLFIGKNIENEPEKPHF